MDIDLNWLVDFYHLNGDYVSLDGNLKYCFAFTISSEFVADKSFGFIVRMVKRWFRKQSRCKRLKYIFVSSFYSAKKECIVFYGFMNDALTFVDSGIFTVCASQKECLDISEKPIRSVIYCVSEWKYGPSFVVESC